MEAKQKAEVASAKKSARANRRQAREEGKDKKEAHKSLRDKVDQEDDDEWKKELWPCRDHELSLKRNIPKGQCPLNSFQKFTSDIAFSNSHLQLNH